MKIVPCKKTTVERSCLYVIPIQVRFPKESFSFLNMHIIYYVNHFWVLPQCHCVHIFVQVFVIFSGGQSAPLCTDSRFPSSSPRLPPSTLCLHRFAYSVNLFMWNHSVFVFSCLVYFTQYSSSRVHPYGSLCQNPLPFWGWVMLRSV